MPPPHTVDSSPPTTTSVGAAEASEGTAAPCSSHAPRPSAPPHVNPACETDSNPGGGGGGALSPVGTRQPASPELHGVAGKLSLPEPVNRHCSDAGIRKLCGPMGTEETMRRLLREVRSQRVRVRVHHCMRLYRRAVRELRAAKDAALNASNAADSVHADGPDNPTPQLREDAEGDAGEIVPQRRSGSSCETRNDVSNDVNPSGAAKATMKLIEDVLNDPAASTGRLRAALQDAYHLCQRLDAACSEAGRQPPSRHPAAIAAHHLGPLDDEEQKPNFPAAVARLSLCSDTSDTQLHSPMLRRARMPRRNHVSQLFTVVPPMWKEHDSSKDVGVQAFSTSSDPSSHGQQCYGVSLSAHFLSPSTCGSHAPERGGREVSGHSAGSRNEEDGTNTNNGEQRSSRSGSVSAASTDSAGSEIRRSTENEKLRQWRLDALRMRGGGPRTTSSENWGQHATAPPPAAEQSKSKEGK
ncbi:uncharacterized protein Tco025E_04523 [Trypanosoma conorhini]|uniref:Uncharacterized protein n=1 Tax=Trypanosoma conorhini TaxID=83891 RepID=A0A3R7NGW4_9TRYP|nr:uncharacterized protein Tco025E_04523 [Trypanosoma conorhini]RNF18377.1 hypothetical protein Tco025E_04523 [Trypanosoma conorhini]